MDYLERYRYWLENAPLCDKCRAEMEELAKNDDDMKGAFGAELQFGTAGIRGIMGIGTNRLNDFTVRRTAQGLAAWLSGTDLPQKCAIGYDSRHNSRKYAEICACALAERGVHTYVYHELAPTPMLSFAVRQLGCGCGIVVSASHNAGAYNGIKCYGPDGCQMTDAAANAVYDEICKLDIFEDVKVTDFDEAVKSGLIEYVQDEVYTSYLDI